MENTMKGTNYIANLKTPEHVLTTNINGVMIDTVNYRNFNCRGDWWDEYECAIQYGDEWFVVGSSHDDSEASRKRVLETHMAWVNRFALEDFDHLIWILRRNFKF